MDVSSPSALFVCSDVIKKVAANATMNKATDHASFITDIVTVVEEIVHEDGDNALEFDVITSRKHGKKKAAIIFPLRFF